MNITEAWLEAEKTCYTQLVSGLKAKDGFNAFRGYLPYERDSWMFSSGGIGSSIAIERFWSANPAWCYMSFNARIEGVYDSRDKCLELAGSVLGVLKDTSNMNQKGNVMWLRLADFPGEPVETPILNVQGELATVLWRITIPLEMVIATEAEYAAS